MKSAVLKKLNGPPEFDDFEDPVVGGQVVVEIAAAAMHHVPRRVNPRLTAVDTVPPRH